MGLLDGDIQAIVGGALDFVMLDVTLTQVVEGSYSAGAGRTNTETDYACRGFVEEDVQRYKDTGLIQRGDRVVQITQTSLAVTPAQGDRVTARGVESAVEDVGQDPASAMWILGVTP